MLYAQLEQRWSVVLEQTGECVYRFGAEVFRRGRRGGGGGGEEGGECWEGVEFEVL